MVRHIVASVTFEPFTILPRVVGRFALAQRVVITILRFVGARGGVVLARRSGARRATRTRATLAATVKTKTPARGRMWAEGASHVPRTSRAGFGAARRPPDGKGPRGE